MEKLILFISERSSIVEDFFTFAFLQKVEQHFVKNRGTRVKILLFAEINYFSQKVSNFATTFTSTF